MRETRIEDRLAALTTRWLMGGTACFTPEQAFN
jgi:hypothetical protein